MVTILGEIRALAGLLGSVGSFRRKRAILLERRRHLKVVLAELEANLAGIRRVWDDEYHVFNWRAWLHDELLSTKDWHQRRMALVSRVDGGPVISDRTAFEIDALYDEFDRAARTSNAYSPDWERRLIELALRLQEEIRAFSRRNLNRFLALRAAPIRLERIDGRVRTPQTPAELQGRALAKLPDGN
ncbi:MAG: hypothetical protein WBQ14_08195 [Gaiellaceae bacterium]